MSRGNLILESVGKPMEDPEGIYFRGQAPGIQIMY
jgi:hypothetical protein